MAVRLVVEFVEGDGCTYSCTTTLPVEYESAEAFIVDFELAAHNARQARVSEFVLADRTFNTDSFFHYNYHTKERTYCEPSIMTIDEWFASAR